jgi:hypothetical protein
MVWRCANAAKCLASSDPMPRCHILASASWRSRRLRSSHSAERREEWLEPGGGSFGVAEPPGHRVGKAEGQPGEPRPLGPRRPLRRRRPPLARTARTRQAPPRAPRPIPPARRSRRPAPAARRRGRAGARLALLSYQRRQRLHRPMITVPSRNEPADTDDRIRDV